MDNDDNGSDRGGRAHRPQGQGGPGRQFADAINALLDAGRIEEAEAAVRKVLLNTPHLTYARNLRSIFERVPPARPDILFVDDRRKDVQVVRRAGAAAVVFVFCGPLHKLGLPLPLVHRWFANVETSIVYLRDFSRLSYLGGIESLAADRDGTVAALGGIARDLAATRTACTGNSGGVFAALHYGLDLGADAVLGLAGPTSISAEMTANARGRRRQAADRTRDLAGDVDLRAAYAAAAKPPSVALTFGAANWDDRLHAEHMAGLPSVRLMPLADWPDHNVVPELIRRGEFEALLRWLAYGA